MQDMFEGKTVRYKIDDNGMQWVLGADLRRAIGITKNVFNLIVSRIRDTEPLAIEDSPALSWALIPRERRGKPRITLNKSKKQTQLLG